MWFFFVVFLSLGYWCFVIYKNIIRSRGCERRGESFRGKILLYWGNIIVLVGFL